MKNVEKELKIVKNRCRSKEIGEQSVTFCLLLAVLCEYILHALCRAFAWASQILWTTFWKLAGRVCSSWCGFGHTGAPGQLGFMQFWTCKFVLAHGE